MLLPFSLSDARSLDIVSRVHLLFTGTADPHALVLSTDAQISDPKAALSSVLRPHILLVPNVHTRTVEAPCILVLAVLAVRLEAQLFLLLLLEIPQRFFYLFLPAFLVTGPLHCRVSNYRFFHDCDCGAS